MKIYISGPITGMDNGNKEAFDGMEHKLRDRGHDVVNPHSLPHNHGKTWNEYMREDLKAMLDCQGAVFLPGWNNSRGARVEYDLALALDLTFCEVRTDADLDWMSQP